ncbi:hypothetical protein QFZ82_003914 [Streptomyces sp. V4I23]|uniref:hypothetical protein n=1 Tax=Streptomyces sp. V4I23 TaxID=3042282 RepID=UPI002788F499|nr:hypothetical protein [Streptomyces sp. V4I23]MDQ1009429.1 hypothetical protein [Streptomyces sp. V4I23]
MGSFSVYDAFVSLDVMVKGSDTTYDSYTYRPGQGVEKGIISNTLSGGDLPFSMDDIDWDVVPALLKRAEKGLNVKKPTLRYILVDNANETFHSPLGLAVHFADDYGGGHLTADLKGKVTRVFPAES